MGHIPLSHRVKFAVAKGRSSGTVWVHDTDRFRIRLEIEPIRGYRYDGDDENGETQAALDAGTLFAFESAVVVELDGEEIARDSLYGSVYGADDFAEFWTAHRDPNPMNRNCSLMWEAHPAGPRVSICHYFPDMVRNAVREARQHVAAIQLPLRVRRAA